MKKLYLFFLVTLSLISFCLAENISAIDNSMNLRTNIHYYRQNQEVTIFSINQSFDSFSLDFIISSNKTLSAFELIDSEPLIQGKFHFNSNSQIYNNTLIIAYTDRINIENYSLGDTINLTNILSAKDILGNTFYGITKDSIQVGRIYMIQEKEKSNNYAFYLLLIFLGLLFLYFLNGKNNYR